MIIARVSFKRKGGWKRAKYQYYVASDLETVKKFAEKSARGSEYCIQTDYVIGSPEFYWRAVNVFDLDDNCERRIVVDGI